jgi:pseudouridine-5'-phosphate glycosidase
MVIRIPKVFMIHPAVSAALRLGRPVVALESAVITHGLPHPTNLSLAREMETIVREQGAVPATVAILDGRVHVGLDDSDLERLSGETRARKISVRDFGPAIAAGASGGTTVAGTMAAASRAGIRVFATGGIGGVHRAAPTDISADLIELGRTPMVVVCAGAKAILDLPATLEYLETQGVPVVGLQTERFPAFYSTDSGLPVSATAASPEEIAFMARAHWEMGLSSALLAVVPPPPADALPRESVEAEIARALEEARTAGVRGPAVTPFLLQKMSELSGGASLRANLALLRNNARIATQIAIALAETKGLQSV